MQAPGLRARFALEAVIALLHAPPTGYPMHLPRPGQCRLTGYAVGAPWRPMHVCAPVHTSIFGMLCFLRLY